MENSSHKKFYICIEQFYLSEGIFLRFLIVLFLFTPGSFLKPNIGKKLTGS